MLPDTEITEWPNVRIGGHLVRPPEGLGLEGVTQKGRRKAWAPNTGLEARAASQRPPSADARSPWPGNPRWGGWQPAGAGEEDYRETDFLQPAPWAPGVGDN